MPPTTQANSWYRASYAGEEPVGFVMISWNCVPPGADTAPGGADIVCSIDTANFGILPPARVTISWGTGPVPTALDRWRTRRRRLRRRGSARASRRGRCA
jgi:hypothetical protein